MNNKKQLLLSIGLVLILVLMIVGISYAAFQFIGPGSKVSTITSGIMKMSYTESDNIINLQGALPTTDETGKKRLNEGEYFDFTVSSTIQGNANINWEIALEPTAPENMFDPNFVKVYLTELDDAGNETQVVEPKIFMNLDMDANEYTGKPAIVEGTEDTIQIPIFTLYSTSTNKSFSKKYRLRIWVDESYNPQGDGGNFEFGTKVNVYGKAGDVMPPTVAQTLQDNGLGENGSFDTSDSEQTFITGTDPNNYIWYSGKLWRAVSIDPTDNSVKLVTQWNISTLPYNASDNTTFEGSYIKQWLNDGSVDGFLGNLRESDKFIKTNSIWNVTMTQETTKSEKTTMVTAPVGLLNIYEYTMSYKNATYETGYLNNGLHWWTLTPYSTSKIHCVSYLGNDNSDTSAKSYGSRPSINLKPTVRIIDGNGTSNNPYRLRGDNDSPTGALLSTRYSGEYISFGTGENNLYRIVSHEGTGTKITSANPLKENGRYKTIAFGSTATFSKDNTIGTFLNGDYLTSGSYLTNDQVNMIEDDTIWYLGIVENGANYKLAKYHQSTTGTTLTTSTNTAKVGLLRLGELMAGQFDKYNSDSMTYWLLTPYSTSLVRLMYLYGDSVATNYTRPTSLTFGSRPAMNLKSNVVITGGKGTKEEPFTIKLGS